MEPTADRYHDADIDCIETRAPINAALDGLDSSINHLALTLGDLQERLAFVLRATEPTEPGDPFAVVAAPMSDLTAILRAMTAKVESLTSTTVAVISRLDL